MPRVMNPPAGRMASTTVLEWMFLMAMSPHSVSEPAPMISRTDAMRARAKVKPMPVPSPSARESTTPFLHANASARPRMMQFTTMRGMKMPSDSESAGRYACMSRSTAVTNVAMITM